MCGGGEGSFYANREVNLNSNQLQKSMKIQDERGDVVSLLPESGLRPPHQRSASASYTASTRTQGCTPTVLGP